MIYKYGPYPIGQGFECPSEIIHFGVQNGGLFIWAVLGSKPCRALIVGTGHPYSDQFSPVSSCFDEPFVWHLVKA